MSQIVQVSSISRNTRCRACKGETFSKVFSFGPTPPANAFLIGEADIEHEQWFPLDVYFCKTCSLLQLLDIVHPDILFREYVYVSSTSPVFVAHFESFTEDVLQSYVSGEQPFVIDIGSNDGILLRPFQRRGARVLGVDPAHAIAAQATASGIPTLPHYFTPKLAEDIVREHGRARIITGTNVFAHVNDLDELLSGVKEALDPVHGVFIVEVPYLVDFLEKNLFDMIYHEHLSYFAVRPLQKLFTRLGMQVFDVERVSSHGGSIRVFAQLKGGTYAVSRRVEQLSQSEEKQTLHTETPYRAFAARVEKNKRELFLLLKSLQRGGHMIAGYGAPAKGNTLLNYFGITKDMLMYIVDDSSWKQNRLTPGTHIPVVADRELQERRPDYILILAWNFADPIMKKLNSFSASGGKFIIPVPEPHIV
ncbi:MAG: SAM-dependent methyltransferase [Parcubacteria group bacterium Gr01-1014_29]|nr:MAG: SAM-dependent methyltransferase [Parcubacteria group bacterium Gr01-1014_29]